MNENAPLQCSCGVTAFADIRFSAVGVMTLTCFHCRKPMQISMSAVMAEVAWERMEREAPEVAASAVPPQPSGYKYGGLL